MSFSDEFNLTTLQPDGENGDKNYDGWTASRNTKIRKTVTERAKRHEEEADDDYLTSKKNG